VRFDKSLVKFILEHAADYEWSLQGFGMLRLHLSDEVRLNVWDSRYRVPKVSMMHTHPWNFTSIVIAGVLINTRFSFNLRGAEYNYALIKPGPGGGLREDLGTIHLLHHRFEYYTEGDVYQQVHNEIHTSSPELGTVTLNIRERVGDDIARVYWPAGEQWVSAEPRKATKEEVEDIVSHSLQRWFE
jgi:hypothetical protein